MKGSRLPIGSSDPTSFICTCPASSNPDGGLVLLFYRYFAAPPSLSLSFASRIADPSELATSTQNLLRDFILEVKYESPKRGLILLLEAPTMGLMLILRSVSLIELRRLTLDTEEKRLQFFKPTHGGCACVFGGSPTSVRVTSEITPMGVTNYIPENWDIMRAWNPQNFTRDVGEMSVKSWWM